jgi:hypothetical protein
MFPFSVARKLFVSLYQGSDIGWNELLDLCISDGSIYHSAEWGHYVEENTPDVKVLRCIVKLLGTDSIAAICLVSVHC